jgi:hypothetical protein
MHGERFGGGFRFRAFQNAAAPPVVGMLNLKSVVFKVAVLPTQSRKFTPARSQCAIQENQQLIPELKHRETELELFRQ